MSRFGSKADIDPLKCNVRFGSGADRSRALFNHLIGDVSSDIGPSKAFSSSRRSRGAELSLGIVLGLHHKDADPSHRLGFAPHAPQAAKQLLKLQ